MQQWVARGQTWVMAVLGVGIIVGIVWLLLLTGVRRWRKIQPDSMLPPLAAGICLAFLLLPLVHHVIGTDGYFYISDAANFFANSSLFQIGAWGGTAVLAYGLARLRVGVVK